MDESRIKLLSEDPVQKAILKLSIPMILGMMVQVFYNLADTYFIGLLGDANQLAAANMSFPIFVILMGIASIIGTGASSYISRCLGKHDLEEANKTTTMSAVLLIGIALLVTVVGLIFSKPLVSMLGGRGETFDYTYQFVAIMLMGSISVIGNFSFGQLLRAEGNAMKSVIGMMIGTVLNLILDPIFIFVFDMGVSGAAIATVIGNTVGFMYYLYVFMSGQTTIKINLKWLKFDKFILGEIFKIGLPSSISQVLAGGASIIANNIAVMYGIEVVAGMGIVTKIMMIGQFIFIGFSTGCQPLIGYNYGAQNEERVKEVIQTGRRLTTFVGIGLSIIFFLSSNVLMSIFTNQEAVMTEGTQIFRILIWSLPFLGGQMIATASAQSMGKAIPAMLLSISRQGILYIPIVLLLNTVFGYYGFLIAQPLTDLLMSGVSTVYLKTVYKPILVSLDNENATV